MLELKGKAAIVTGASSDDGIGSECAKILASRGCNVVVNYATNRAALGHLEKFSIVWSRFGKSSVG